MSWWEHQTVLPSLRFDSTFREIVLLLTLINALIIDVSPHTCLTLCGPMSRTCCSEILTELKKLVEAFLDIWYYSIHMSVRCTGELSDSELKMPEKELVTRKRRKKRLHLMRALKIMPYFHCSACSMLPWQPSIHHLC